MRARGEGIESTGILQPLLVVPTQNSSHDTRYRLVAGERRFRASLEAGLAQVPAFVLPLRDEELLLTQIIENLQRRDLPPLDEARGLEQFMREQKLSIRDVARALGKDKGYIENRLRLLRMGSDLQELVSVRTDTLQHARFIDPVQDTTLRHTLIQAVIEEGISAREVQRRIEQASHPDTTSTSSTTTIPDANKDEVTTGTTGQEVSVRTDTSQTHGQNATGSRDAEYISDAGTGNKESQNKQAKTPLPTVLSQLNPVAAMTAEAARLIGENPQFTKAETAAIHQQLAIIEEQIEHIKTKLQ